MNRPQMFLMEQSFPPSGILDVVATVEQQWNGLLDENGVSSGQRVGIAVGSRGIADLQLVVVTTCRLLQSRGLIPVIIPAMGSHGGATASGQAAVLRQLGVDPNALGVEMNASMETTLLGDCMPNVPIYFARAALEVDHLLLINRIKPHTRFAGEIQSGLRKMLTIGLGKHRGAETFHRAAQRIPFDELILAAEQIIHRQAPLLGGMALLENVEKTLSTVEAIPREKIAQREPDLLRQSIEKLPVLPVKEIDLLIVDEIGKEISGTGMDTNVIGRKWNDHVSTPQDRCQTKYILVQGLTEKTEGNGNGIGMAEFATPEAVSQVDWKKTGINALTAGHPTSAMCPVVLENQAAVIVAVEKILGPDLRIVHIQNTQKMQRFAVSKALLEELPDAVKVLGPVPAACQKISDCE